MGFAGIANVKNGMLAAFVVAFAAFPDKSHAYSEEQERLCTGDAMRLCSAFIPDVDRITACMASQRSQLSPGCRAVFHAPAAQQATPVATWVAKPARPKTVRVVARSKPAKKPKRPPSS